VQKRNEEILSLKHECREKEEVLQQKEIDIACLKGQVQKVLDDLGDSEYVSSTLTACSSEEDVLVEDLASDGISE
jgi:hypothetical protein